MPRRRRDAPADPLLAIGCTDAVPIASGGYSVVYRARQPGFDRLVALKVLTVPVVDERGRRRFERELNLAGRLTGHPNVVMVFASGFLADGRGYVMMEYCPGGSLADRLAVEGTLPVRDVVSVGVKMCGVLELASREGIVHRDVKPANILVTRFGEPALSDFGVAVLAGETTGSTQALTPAHAAPELLESGDAGPAVDQWALASTLYTLLAGRPPFAGTERDGMLAGMLRVLSDPVPTIPRVDIPGDLQQALERAMAKTPSGRWPTAADFGRSLQAVERAAGWPVTSLPHEEVPDAHRYGLYTTPAPDVAAAPSFPLNDVTHPRSRRGSHPSPPDDQQPPVLVPPTDRPERAPVSNEPTRAWSRRSAPPQEEPAPPVSAPRRWWMTAAGGLIVVVVVGVVIGVVASRGSSGPKITGRTPRLQSPSPGLATQLAPRDVAVINEQPTAVTIRWVDPNNGRYPFVVKLSDGSVHTTTSDTETVVGGLQPTKGYCFVVGAVYGVGGQVANAAPVCVRGGTM